MTTTIQDISTLLAASSATQEFKDAVTQLQQGRTSDRIAYNPGVPPVKALRAISKLLEEEPALAIDSVNIQANSGCSDFVGTIDVNGGEVRFKFVWDCAWRAKAQGYEDHFGYPDQIRAAREFGYQCFKKFERQ
jgi:hypothetical protein